MSEAPRVVYVAFIGDECTGVFVTDVAAQETTRSLVWQRHGIRLCEEGGGVAHTGLFWSSWQNNRCTLHVSDKYSTHQDFVAHIEEVNLERRSPGERRR